MFLLPDSTLDYKKSGRLAFQDYAAQYGIVAVDQIA